MPDVDEESINKGAMFEKYVEGLFHPLEFEILWKSPPFLTDTYTESMELPDFMVFHKRTKHQIWIEAKYRTNTVDNMIEWCKPEQLDKYKKFREKHGKEKFFVILGFMGTPDNPDKLYLFDLDDVEYNAIYKNKLVKHQRETRTLLTYDYGVLI